MVIKNNHYVIKRGLLFFPSGNSGAGWKCSKGQQEGSSHSETHPVGCSKWWGIKSGKKKPHCVRARISFRAFKIVFPYSWTVIQDLCFLNSPPRNNQFAHQHTGCVTKSTQLNYVFQDTSNVWKYAGNVVWHLLALLQSLLLKTRALSHKLSEGFFLHLFLLFPLTSLGLHGTYPVPIEVCLGNTSMKSSGTLASLCPLQISRCLI